MLGATIGWDSSDVRPPLFDQKFRVKYRMEQKFPGTQFRKFG